MVATVRFYAQKLPDHVFKESSVRVWRNAYYTREMQTRQRKGGDMTVTELPEKKRGRSFLLGDEFDKQVRDYLTSLRAHGAVVNKLNAMSVVSLSSV